MGLKRIVTKLGAYVLAGAAALGGLGVGLILAEQFSAPIQRTVAEYMLKREQGTLADEGIEGRVKQFLDESNIPTLTGLVQKFKDEVRVGSVILEDRNGVPYAELQHRKGKVLNDSILVKPVPLSAMSPYLFTAAVAAEDERFEYHYAWDVFSGTNALIVDIIKWLQGDSDFRGAITIEIQIADKLECAPTDSGECKHPTVAKKIREGLLSALIERTSAKKEILETYLNLMYFGYDGTSRSHLIGVEAAAERYFAKHAADLTLMESVLMAAMIKNPGDYGTKAYDDILAGNTRTEKVDDMMRRAEHILEKMLEIGDMLLGSESGIPYQTITGQEQMETLRQLRYRKLPFAAPRISVSKATAYEYQQIASDRLKRVQLPTAGQHTTMRIRTSLDLELQKKSREVLTAYVEKIRASGIKSPECLNGSVVVLDTKTNDLLALVDGTGIEKNMLTCKNRKEGDYVQRTQNPTSTGSTIKPFLAWMYLEHGGSMQDVFYDGPKTFKYPFGKRFKTWNPHNFKNRYKGNVTLEDATVDSLNSVYAEINEKLIRDLGAERIRNVLSLTGLDVKEYWLATALGAEVRPLAFAGAFSMFANGGMTHWYETGDANLRMIRSIGYENVATGEQHERVIARRSMQAVSSPAVGQAVDHALREVVKRGTAKGVNIPGYDVRGKTGTGKTSFMFIGYEPALNRLVMVQFTSDLPGKTGTYSNRFTGGEYAVPAAREIFEYMIQKETKM